MPKPSSLTASVTGFELPLRAVLAAVAIAGASTSQAQEGAPPQIYKCVDGSGRTVTSDRPIAACLGRDQHILNSDGSVRRIVPPTLTTDERAEKEAREREAAALNAAQKVAVIRDRSLMQRFPDERSHLKAREKALDDSRTAVQKSESRVVLLKAERKRLLEEAEFYVGKPQPAKLRLSLDANDASLEAQNSLIQNQQAEVVRINGLYDSELDRLRKLWAGAPAGSLRSP